MRRRQLKFLHIADLHLDRSFNGGRLKLPVDKAQARARELRDALTAAVALAKAQSVEIILIAGDLWEEESLAPDTVPFVLDTLGKAGVPVVVSPGNHDYYAPGSHYNAGIVKARFNMEWPTNVFVFREYDFSSFEPPGLDGVQITGIAYRSNAQNNLRPLRTAVDVPPGDLHIGMLHGSREEFLPAGKMRTLPFTDAELLAQPFDYTALGHYHARSSVSDKKGKIRAAYPGSTCALNIDETGERGVLVGVAERGGVSESELVFHRLDRRRIFRFEVDVTGLKHVNAVEEAIRKQATEAGISGEDMALVELTGIFAQAGRLVFSDGLILGLAYHARIDQSRVRPEWDMDEADGKSPPITTQSLFRARMREMIQQAEALGDNTEAARLQNALYYGLDALHGVNIAPRS